MITPSLLKTFEFFEKLREKQMDDDLKNKISNHILRYIPVTAKQPPAELDSFIDNLVRREGFGNKDVIKQAVFKLAEDNKISHTTGKDGKMYFTRYK